MKNLQGKKALVTGAASGIGRAIALALAKQGAHLHLLDVNEEQLEEVASEVRRYGVEAHQLLCNLTRSTEITQSTQLLLTRWGALDILINNAGVAYYGATERMTAEEWDWLLKINLLAPIQLTHELLPTLLEQPEAHILNVCSIMGLIAMRGVAAYQVSKFGLVGFSQALRAEYARQGIGVTALCPGVVRTPLFENAITRKRRALSPSRWMSTTPEKVASRAVKAIKRNKGLVIITPLARLLWYAHRLMPGVIDYFRCFSRNKKGKVKSSDELLKAESSKTNRESESLSMQVAEIDQR